MDLVVFSASVSISNISISSSVEVANQLAMFSLTVAKLPLATHELDIAFGNHTFHTQPTDCSLIC